MKKFDLIVIGFGKAGKTIAAKAASMGKKVALVEKSASMYGGTCINVGCIPSKKLLTLSEAAKAHSDKKAYFTTAMQTKDALISALRAKNYAMLNDLSGVCVIDGVASFEDKESVKVRLNDGTEELLSAPNIIINSGSKDAKPKFEINSTIAYTSEQILSLSELPERLVVVGGGYIGLEMASIYANFGSKVTILSRSNLLKNEDIDIRESVIAALKAQGIIIYEGVQIDNIGGDSVRFMLSNESLSLQADAFLLATGRCANTEELDLFNASIATDDAGNIIVNEFLQTSEPNIYAVGDVKGGELFTYISLDDYRIVFDHLYGSKKRSTKNRSVHASVVFMDTPLAKVGLSKETALKAGYNPTEISLPMAAVPGAKILGHDTGLLKAVVDASTREILGASFHAVQAHEVINTLAVAMGFRASADFMKAQIFTHPSISEALNELFNKFN